MTDLPRLPRLCHRCKLAPAQPEKSYCAQCQAKYLSEWRKANPRDSISHRRKELERTSGLLKRRGYQEPCACGSTAVVATHPDQTRPLYIRWSCEACIAAAALPVARHG